MTKKYRVYDINHGLLAPDVAIEADTAMEAVRQCGYKNIYRDYSGKYGNIVVQRTNGRGSYVYFAEEEKR